jgi:hypothetical protein
MAKRNKKSVSSAVSLNSIDHKICELHKAIKENSIDIQQLKQEIAYGKGGVKVLVFIIGIVTTLAAAWNIFGKSD